MSKQAAEADRRIENTLLTGKVIEVDAASGKARVDFGGELETQLIPWMAQRAAENHSWWPLQIGEWVMVGAPSGDLAQAVILGAIPTGTNPPHGAADTFRLSFAGGSYIEFAGGNITIHATGDLILQGANVRLN
ncbi:phage baseplate assembly protein V [Leisingera sp. MMG026]|uniref:phage baseplate assembly protein V n=1 Tax=Leisingera sp. MMG026 TaxID=2909982 RepID=UPI001F0080EF|nr:phage baseplate assembly protein V [Leisingera sp. MMG026]MCF6432911.1 phage baseplate assembly protein V [Leisingera sp. MMG026]